MKEEIKGTYIYLVNKYMEAKEPQFRLIIDYKFVASLINKYRLEPKHQKQGLRKIYQIIRDRSISIETHEKACMNACEILIHNNCKNIGLYSPIKNEVDTNYIAYWSKMYNINLHYPKVKNDALIFCRVFGPTDLTSGYCGILEPDEKYVIDPKSLDAIIIPGLAFDINTKNRLGYGKGHYDRFLPKTRSNTILIGLTIEECLRFVPTEKHDIKVDNIATEKKIY